MWASEKYRESWQPASKWIDQHAPDFVKECIDEMYEYILYLRDHLDKRDSLIKNICINNGIDPNMVLKPESESEDTKDDDSRRNSPDTE